MIVMTSNTINDLDSFDQEDETPKISEPLSPAGGAESLFLAGLATAQLSKDALSTTLQLAQKHPQSIFERRSISAASVRSAMTDDFQSCADFSSDDNLFDPSFDDSDTHDDDTAFFSFFSPIKNPRSIMTSSSSRKKKSRAVVAEDPLSPSSPPTVPEEGMDVAEHVYEKAKEVWAWGKGVPLVSIGFGITEAVVKKAVSMAGTDLEKLDRDIKPQLANFDTEFINPAIKAVIAYAQPIIIKFLSPFGLIKNEAENPEMTN
jgi:hypothetical protein